MPKSLKARTRSKFEYAIGKAMGMEVNAAVDMFMEIAEFYHREKIIRALKEPAQRSLLDEELL